MLDQALGIGIGLVVSIVSWLAIQGVMAPRLRWSLIVSKRPSAFADNGYSYRVKCKNVSWLRPVTDVRLEAHVVIGGLDVNRPKNTVRLRLETSTTDVLQLLPGGTRLVSIDPTSLTPYMQRRLRDLGVLSQPLNLVSLESLLELGTRARLVCGALAHDSWTGRQRFCQSHDYTLGDIRIGDFETRRSAFTEGLVDVRDAVRSFRRGRRRRWVELRHPTLRLRRGSSTVAAETNTSGGPIEAP